MIVRYTITPISAHQQSIVNTFSQVLRECSSGMVARSYDICYTMVYLTQTRHVHCEILELR